MLFFIHTCTVRKRLFWGLIATANFCTFILRNKTQKRLVHETGLYLSSGNSRD